MKNTRKKAIIVLEDGMVFEGSSFGAAGESCGEVVFNTSLTGYQEVLTDPSYKGQIVAMTYPLIGNYGVNPEDAESRKLFLEGFIVKENSRIYSNWRGKKSVSKYLKENNIIGIEGVDTRALTRHIRIKGSMKTVISTEDFNIKSLLRKVKASRGLVGKDLVAGVTTAKTYNWNNSGKYKVVVVDCGVKRNILRELEKKGCKVTVVPAKTSAADILNLKPNGVFLSNGPGDPAAVPYVVAAVKELLGKLPIFGICLGHQILGLAFDGKTGKLKFGHHGGNHPVKDLETGKINITAQNHNFYVDIKSLKKSAIEITHLNLNDNTLEGMRHKKLPVYSIQFHPEAAPGPNDAKYLFEEFINNMKKKAKQE